MATMMATILRASIAVQIRNLRLAHGISQAKMAEGMRTGQDAISNLENPTGSWPSVSTLIAVSRYFDVALLIRFDTYEKFIGIYCGEPLAVPPSFDREALDPLCSAANPEVNE